MSDSVIRAEGLSKRYRRGVRRDSGLRHVLERFVKSPLAAFRKPKHETFWALRDVNLEVGEGEVVGLIGRNGAGKTTLLKILSRITRPTDGWAEIHGRVRSLLEVGTGFHPELTGRENTYLSGSILGMSRQEIERKFAEIVAFAEIEKFIDTPVKHYSSGMYVRLAFAVAAHLEPEILLVDEVLAVGDVNFQKKCLGKMGDVARAGRTVILVSHQLNQIRRLCHRVIWVDDGQIRLAGPTHEVVSAYESAMSRGERSVENTNIKSTQHRAGEKARFIRWEITQPKAAEKHTLNEVGSVTVKFTVEVNKIIHNAHHGIALYDHEQRIMWGLGTDGINLQPGEHDFCYTFPILPLRPGPYMWLVSLWEDQEQLDAWYCTPEMIVAVPDHQHRIGEWSGILNVPSEFSIPTRVSRG